MKKGDRVEFILFSGRTFGEIYRVNIKEETFDIIVVLKKLYNKKLKELEEKYIKSSKNIEHLFKELRIKQDKDLISARYEVSNENKLYLSRMNKDISAKIKELADIVKNRPII